MASNKPDITTLLASADKQYGFPAGTMASVVQQETGGNAKYITDPSAYHYGLNDKGQRIAGHSGKTSTAFGPFGILESTAKDPGYGVKPLQGKDLVEQVRFAGEYLAARVKKEGSLEAGIAGYGEGPKYAQQVLGRIGKISLESPLAMPDAQVAGGMAPGPGGGVPDSLGGQVEAMRFASLNRPKVSLPPEDAAGAPVRQKAGGPDPWMQLAQYMPRAVTAADFNQISQAAPQVNMTNPSWRRKL